MSDAVLYNTLAWVVNGSSQYATNVASWINTWFLANDTYMNPNMNYGQMVRGPTSNIGNHTGVHDLKCMVKVVNAVLVLRAGNAPGWTSAIDSGIVTWTKSYIDRMAHDQPDCASRSRCNQGRDIHARYPPLGKVSYASHCMCLQPGGGDLVDSNHGSYYYGQLAALQILMNDTTNASATIQKYCSALYKNQISGTGEQVRGPRPI
jgi:hypothetical protein